MEVSKARQMSYCKLTICYESPFWIGLIETENDDGYRVARHVFGDEPTDPQIFEFIRDHWNDLCFTEELKIEKPEGRKINHKRMQRLISKEIAANARRGTKAQQALAQQREADKLERRQQSKAQREAEKQERFAKRQEKRKQKHRGH